MNSSGVVDTSRVAYREIKKKGLGDRQRAVLDVIRYLENPTNNEISRFIGMPINTITPRTYELVESGSVIKGLKRICGVTGKKVLTWRAVL